MNVKSPRKAFLADVARLTDEDLHLALLGLGVELLRRNANANGVHVEKLGTVNGGDVDLIVAHGDLVPYVRAAWTDAKDRRRNDRD